MSFSIYTCKLLSIRVNLALLSATLTDYCSECTRKGTQIGIILDNHPLKIRVGNSGEEYQLLSAFALEFAVDTVHLAVAEFPFEAPLQFSLGDFTARVLVAESFDWVPFAHAPHPVS